MKTIVNILLFFSLFLIFSCNSDDDPIDGTWNLVHVSGGFIPINVQFDRGDYTWTFNSVLVVNNESPDSISGFVPTAAGTYNYELTTGEANTLLTINGSTPVNYAVFGDSMRYIFTTI